MSTPVKRHTKAARNNRRSHFALKNASALKCECGQATVPHQACQSCGMYKGNKAINVEKRTIRRVIRQKPMQKAS